LFRLDLSLMALEASIVLSGCGKTLPSDNTLTIAQDMLASATMTALAASQGFGHGSIAQHLLAVAHSRPSACEVDMTDHANVCPQRSRFLSFICSFGPLALDAVKARQLKANGEQ